VSGADLRERAREELLSYAIVAAYLYVCFAVLMLYENTVLGRAGGTLLPHGFAAIKALVLGKFILIGEAVGIGTRIKAGTLAMRIAVRSLLLLLLLLLLTLVEELVMGRVHGHSLAEVLADYGQQPMLGLLAKCLLVLLVLVPLVAAREINRALGPGVLRRLLFDSER
jgi:hypothetical protein